MALKGFRAVANALQGYIAGTWGVRIYGDEILDTESGFNTANGTYTVPAGLDGLYGVFDAGWRGGSVDTAFEFEVSTDGGSNWSQIATARVDPTITLAQTMTTGPVLLTSGHLWRTRGLLQLTQNAVADPRAFFGLSVLDHGTFSGFRALSNATQALTAGTSLEVQFANEIFDTESAYDGTSRFTVPASWNGKWARFDCGTYIDGTGNLYLARLQRSTDGGSNWADFARNGCEAPVYFHGKQVSGQIRVNTGDIIRALVAQSASGRSVQSGNFVFFSGYLCGGL
jgi:hypothetical protein